MIDTQEKRPLSPHLTIYRPQITSVLSILHRLSGIFIFLGLLVFCWVFVFTALGCDCGNIKQYAGNILVQLLLFAWSSALFYHFFNGVRHLFWDIGKGMSNMRDITMSGILVLVLSLLASLASWYIALN